MHFPKVFDLLEQSNGNLYLGVPCYYTLIHFLNNEDFLEHGQEFCELLVDKLDIKYWDSFSSYYITATFLTPCFSEFHFCTQNWKDSTLLMVLHLR